MDIDLYIFNILKSRKYNRYKVMDKNKLLKSINYFTSQNRPISLVEYWGVTNKSGINIDDINTIEFLQSINNRIKKCYSPGLYLNIIISDTHAYLNGYTLKEIKDYIEKLQKLFSKYNNIHYMLLSNLRNNLNLKSIEKIDCNISDELKPFLIKGASKFYKGDILEGIDKYYRIRVQEKDIFYNLFSNCIFFTYNNPKYKEILPDITTLFLYTRKGYTHPPWVI